VLVFEQRHIYAFILRLTVEEHVFILESYLKTKRCLTSTVDKGVFEKFRRQAPVKSDIVKMV
jgi:hypothetical protein